MGESDIACICLLSQSSRHCEREVDGLTTPCQYVTQALVLGKLLTKFVCVTQKGPVSSPNMIVFPHSPGMALIGTLEAKVDGPGGDWEMNKNPGKCSCVIVQGKISVTYTGAVTQQHSKTDSTCTSSHLSPTT